MRNGLVRQVERGRVQQIDVCDAHPELLRAARNVGRPTKEVCPICDDGRLVTVTFVFGAKLPPGGRCPGTAAELKAPVPAPRARALLRGRGLPLVRLAPPHAEVPRRRARQGRKKAAPPGERRPRHRSLTAGAEATQRRRADRDGDGLRRAVGAHRRPRPASTSSWSGTRWPTPCSATTTRSTSTSTSWPTTRPRWPGPSPRSLILGDMPWMSYHLVARRGGAQRGHPGPGRRPGGQARGRPGPAARWSRPSSGPRSP